MRKQSFLERKRKSEVNHKILSEIQALLHLPNLPKKIEGYDPPILGNAFVWIACGFCGW